MDQKRTECDLLFQKTLNINESKKQMAISLLNLAVIFALVFCSISAVSGGIFLGVVLSSIFSAIVYYDASSITSLALLILTFGIIVYIISKLKR